MIDREIFFHSGVVQIEFFFNILAVVVAIVPNVELAIERNSERFVFGFLESEEIFKVLFTNGSKLVFKVIEELIDESCS
jgi:hypothetical protein